ncbi:MAG: hypothetical protein DME82_07680 [Verrucomicrobia bacterium]|nr:MAG: hypothetical protein DME82_07680 [Verrucomicrobiota bacterium]
MPHSYDAIVIGAGHNGLTCACYLARAGLNRRRANPRMFTLANRRSTFSRGSICNVAAAHCRRRR